MMYYKVKPEYDQTYKNPRIHNADILVKNALYTEAERKKMQFVSDKCFEIVDIPRNKTGLFFGVTYAFAD